MNSNRTFKKRLLALVIAILAVVLVIGAISPVVAYYIRSTGEVSGSYEPGTPSTPDITNPQPVQSRRISFLSDTETSIENLYIQIPDQGYPVYVRAAVIVTWLKPADCICTQPVCGSHICKDCTCDGCKECETCAKGILCENCETCEHKGDIGDCKDCVEVECDDCEECAEDNCTDCKKEEGGCTGCVICSPNRDEESCGECAACETYCLDRDECPRCNDDDIDDWDIIFPQPTEGEKKDYLLTFGDKWDEKWMKQDNSGFYYHKQAVESNGSATGSTITVDWNLNSNTPFIKKFERLPSAELPITVDGLDVKDCVLKVEIIVQTVQAIGSTDWDDNIYDKDEIPAWKDAWGEGYDEWSESGQY